jgi:CheY-like chemotaxis protein
LWCLCANDVAVERIAMNEIGTNSTYGVHVLVLDDDAPIRGMLQHGITRASYSCLTACNAEAALKTIGENNVDLV